jgi:hypothetical protein
MSQRLYVGMITSNRIGKPLRGKQKARGKRQEAKMKNGVPRGMCLLPFAFRLLPFAFSS